MLILYRHFLSFFVCSVLFFWLCVFFFFFFVFFFLNQDRDIKFEAQLVTACPIQGLICLEFGFVGLWFLPLVF